MEKTVTTFPYELTINPGSLRDAFKSNFQARQINLTIEMFDKKAGIAILDFCTTCGLMGHRGCRSPHCCTTCRGLITSKYFKENKFHIPKGTHLDDFLSDLSNLSDKIFQNRKGFMHLPKNCPRSDIKCKHCGEPHKVSDCPQALFCNVCSTFHGKLDKCAGKTIDQKKEEKEKKRKKKEKTSNTKMEIEGKETKEK